MSNKFRLFTLMALAISSAAVTAQVLSNQETQLAQWGEASLTTSDMDVYFSSYSAEEKARFMLQRTFIAELMQDMMLQKLALAEADDSSLLADEGVRKQIEKQQRRILFEHYRDQYVQNNLLEDYTQVALEKYTLNKAKYIEPEKRVVSHVLVATDTRSKAEAAELVEAIKQQLNDGEIEFVTAIEQYSDDPSKHTNLGLIDVEPGKTVKPFEAAAYQLQQLGQISEPVLTNYGYHLIRLDEVIQSRQKEFSEVQERLVVEVRVEHQQRLWEQHLMSLKRSAGIPNINQENVTRYLQNELQKVENIELLIN